MNPLHTNTPYLASDTIYDISPNIKRHPTFPKRKSEEIKVFNKIERHSALRDVSKKK
jgi:hypothetical protein